MTLGNSFSLSEPQRHGRSPLGQGGSLGDSSSTLHVVYQKKQVWVTLQFRNSPEQNPWPLQDGVLLPSPYSLHSDPAPDSASWDVWGPFPPCSLHCVFSACKSLAPDLPMAVSHFSGLGSNAFFSVGPSVTTLPKVALPYYSLSNDFYGPTGRNALYIRTQYTRTQLKQKVHKIILLTAREPVIIHSVHSVPSHSFPSLLPSSLFSATPCRSAPVGKHSARNQHCHPLSPPDN